MMQTTFKFSITCFLLFFCTTFIFAQPEKRHYFLESNWQFRQANTSEWMDIQIPGSVHTGLLKNRKIDDPFYRDNEKKLQWIENEDWEFKSEFTVQENHLDAKAINLIFHGIDTYADIFVNGKKLLYTNNMFRSWKVDVSKLVHVGKNELRVFFYSPAKKTAELFEQLGYELPGGQRVMARKAQFHFGWDWGPRFCGIGLWRNVELQVLNDPRIDNIWLPYSIADSNNVVLNPKIEVTAFEETEAEIHFNIAQKNKVEKVLLQPGKNTFTFQQYIPEAELWWPNGMGKPQMYEANVLLKIKGQPIDSFAKKTGFRKVELITEKDDKGKSFYFKINGQPVFMKGANYIPQNIFQSKVTTVHYLKTIQEVVDANMNMLRVWGGGIYENKRFYQLCDEKGIMVWQDFMFACAMYPGDDAFLENVAAEAKENILRLVDHPSIALWCGNNENSEGWHRWGWQNAFSKNQRKKIWEDYQKLFQQLLPELVKEHTPGTPYWESSPQFGRGNPQHQFEGDAHYWGVWHDAEPFEMFEKKVPRFMSEYGFQSFPAEATINSFTLPEDRNPDSEIMLVHQKHPRGNKLIREYMQREYPEPPDFPAFIYTSQLLQAEGIRKGIDAHRRARPYCMGTLYWQLNDCWPVASWSSVDFYHRKKALHYFVTKAYADIAVVPVIDSNSIQLFLLSDYTDIKNGNILLQMMNFKGRVLHQKTIPVRLKKGNSKLVFEEAVSDWLQNHDPAKVFLNVKLQDQKNVPERNAYFVIPKLLDLPKATILKKASKVANGYEVKLETDQFARAVYLQTEVDGQFEDNFIDLIPGEASTIIFKTRKKVDNFGETLKIQCLNDW